MTKITDMTPEERLEARARSKEKYLKLIALFESQNVDTLIKRFRLIPERYQKKWLKVYMGEGTRATAIKAKCCECAGYESIPENVGQCIIKECPLWHFRPYQKSKGKIDENSDS